MMDCLTRFSFAAVFRDLKILIRADFLDADEHAAFPTLTPHFAGRPSPKFQRKMEPFSKIWAMIYHYTLENSRSDHPLRS